MLLTARQIKDACGDTPFIYRAGVWKPRTSPSSFQGVGEEALEWLVQVQRELSLPVATEVATPEHVAKALATGIDYLWIGARTSANPIAVSAIADAIGNYQHISNNLKGILIKNPVNADAELWLGNIERLEKTDIPVIAVHRGCNHQPCWSMAHKVRTKRPDIPMLLDPSHLSGDAAKVPALMTKITELGLDGTMTEVHCCPEDALSDKQQQLAPSQLRANIEPMSSQCRADYESATPHRGTTQAQNPTELNWLRAEIDELDDRIWETIAARMDVSLRIGEWKKANKIAPLQPERFADILAHRLHWAEKNGIGTDFVRQLMEAIHKESLKRQE